MTGVPVILAHNIFAFHFYLLKEKFTINSIKNAKLGVQGQQLRTKMSYLFIFCKNKISLEN